MALRARCRVQSGGVAFLIAVVVLCVLSVVVVVALGHFSRGSRRRAVGIQTAPRALALVVLLALEQLLPWRQTSGQPYGSSHIRTG